MSGIYTAKQIFDLSHQETRDREINDHFKILGIQSSDGGINPAKILWVEQVMSSHPDDIIYLSANGNLISQTEKSVMDNQSNNNAGGSRMNNTTPGLIGETRRVPLDRLSEILDSHCIDIKEDLIRATLEDYVSTIPKYAEPYLNGEITIFYYSNVGLSIKNLVAAGTKILDAVLYYSYQGLDSNQSIFSMKELGDTDFDPKEAVERISNSHKAIKGAFATIYNQGYLPMDGSVERGLSQFVKVTLFGNANFTSSDLAKMLSSANTQKFPSQVFLNINIERLPTDVASRCKMSIAGNRVVRYAMLAKGFERAPVPNTMGINDNLQNQRAMREYKKWETATEIVDFLCSISADWKSQLKMHPLNPQKPTIKNFTLKLTHAVLFSLSQIGRQIMRGKIVSDKIEAFKKDENFYGKTDASGNLVYAIFVDPNADFSDMSVGTVRGAYGIV
uniref:Coat protein n=1 Tax=Gymnadenia ophiovirus_den TaxID=2983944 RepID=A0A9N7ABF0_9VIRU|nr:TPA_asm: coat protein [Gymnadenia ophiovirus_den]